MTEAQYATSEHASRVGFIRVAIGLLQGLALYLLVDAFYSSSWPTTEAMLYSSLCVVAIFVPLLVIAGITALRVWTFAGWIVAALMMCAALAAYDIYRDPVAPPSNFRNIASSELWLALASMLFIGHSLVVAADDDRRLIAGYPTYFGVAWKLGLQLVMASLFAGMFWLVLWLGAEMFNLIKISYLSELIRKKWFWIPATTVALSYAIHVTDVRITIIRSIRTISCNMLSWLLPLLTLIAIGFVTALLFTGLEPLWQTRRASVILLVAAASLIFLINSAFQDGARFAGSAETGTIAPLLRFSILAASAVLIPLVALAAYAIWLRVGQYGWSPQRITAAACAIIAACYAAGYGIAAIRPHASASAIATTNVATAFVILVALLALKTPLADPGRISVNDQLQRLETGLIAAETFDYALLRFQTGRYGTEALRELAEQRNLPVAAEKSAAMLQKKTLYEAQRFGVPQISSYERRSNIRVAYPWGTSLPRDFVETDWAKTPRSFMLPSCLTGRAKCDAVLSDLDGDSTAEIILVPPSGQSSVLRLGKDHAWSYLGSLVDSHCAGVRDELLAGRFQLASPAIQELEVSGRRLRLNPTQDCSPGGTVIIKAP